MAEPLSRRRFLWAATAGLLAGSGTREPSGGERGEHGPLRLFSELGQQEFRPIEYVVYSGDVSVETQAIMTNILAAQQRGATLEDRMQAVARYNHGNYAETVGYEIPQNLAAEGIYVEVVVNLGADHKLLGPDCTFYRIGAVSERQVERWGKSLTVREVKAVSEPKEATEAKTQQSAVTVHGCAILFPEGITKQLNGRSQDLARLRQSKTFQLTLPEHLAAIQRQPDRKLACMQGAVARSLRTLGDTPIVLADFENVIREHETGHLVDAQDPAVVRFFENNNSTPAAFKRKAMENSFYAESSGFLSQLRYAPNARLALFEVLYEVLSKPKGKKFSVHAYAATAISERLGELLVEQPGSFGLSIDEGASLEPKHQAMVQLADALVNNEAGFKALVEKVYVEQRALSR